MMVEINNFAALIIEHTYDIVMLLLVCSQTLLVICGLVLSKGWLVRKPARASKRPLPIGFKVNKLPSPLLIVDKLNKRIALKLIGGI